MDVPPLGPVVEDPDTGWLYSHSLFIPVLERECQFALEGYGVDPKPTEFHFAIANMLYAERKVLLAVESELFRYYKDYEGYCIDEGIELIESPGQIWQHIEFHSDLLVKRRSFGDRRVYVSCEAECSWEAEHGLQIVFKEGAVVNKVGPYHDQLTNVDAFGDPSLEEMIYHSPFAR